MHAGRSLLLLRKRHCRSRQFPIYLRVLFWGSSYGTEFLRRVSSRSARRCVDLADLAKRAMHADRKVSGSKDKGGA